jgi:acyl carrier protein
MAEMENRNPDQVSTQIKTLIAEIIEVPEEDVGGDVPLATLGADSLMALEIVAAIEKKYRIKIPEEDLQRVKTFNDVVSMTQEYLQKKPEA